MTISELKTLNLQRLCRERHVNATKLGELLNASKAHGSQLLLGKSGVGDETIRKLCDVWQIDEIEFVRMGGNEKERLSILEEDVAIILQVLEKTVGKGVLRIGDRRSWQRPPSSS